MKCLNCDKKADAKIKVTQGRLTQRYGLCLNHYQELLEKGNALYSAPKGWAMAND